MKLYFLGKTIKPQNSTSDHPKCLVWPETKHFIFVFKLFTPFYLLQAGKPQNKNKCYKLKSWAVSLWNHHIALTAVSQNCPLCLWLKLFSRFQVLFTKSFAQDKRASQGFHLIVWNHTPEKIWNYDLILPTMFLIPMPSQNQFLPENILPFFS